MLKPALFAAAILALLVSLGSAQTGPIKLTSPDGRIEISFQTDAAGQLNYTVSSGGEPIIAPSKLGLTIQGGLPLGASVRIVTNRIGGANETYEMVHGKANPVRNHYRSASIDTTETTFRGRRLIIEARAYDDGVAFRYVVPAQDAIPDPTGFRLSAEHTEFRFARDSITWPLYLSSYTTSYEDEYHREAVSGISPDHLIGLPLTVEYPSVGYVAITEANLAEYAGAYLRRGAGNSFQVDLASAGGPKVEHGLPHQSPWRVIMVAPEMGRLVESNIVINLNPPSKIADPTWIKPGKSAWDWWFGKVKTPGGWETGMNTRTFKYLIDFAAEAGFQYVLVDDGWTERQNILEPKPEIEIREIIDYGKSKGIGIWLWLHWTGVDRQMHEAFPLYSSWGAAGLKIDFMDRDDQWMVNWYHRVLETAAENRLMVDFHGAYKPTGIRRTWPNLMTREGVMGLEYTKWSRRVGPEHNMIIPFTRMLAGPLDYTPGGFGNVTRAEFEPRFDDPVVLGTRAHQLALFVVFESPFVCAVDHPSAYRGAPEFQFIKDVPATWDETRVIDGVIGDYIVIARRSGDDWYLAAATDWTPRVLDIPLDFLGAGDYTARIYEDGANAANDPARVDVSSKDVTKSTVLKATLAAGGGLAVQLRK